MTTLQQVFMWSCAVLSLKTILGFRFPWEICACCKRKMRDHSKKADSTHPIE